MKYSNTLAIIAAATLLATGCSSPSGNKTAGATSQKAWRPLFNGKDLAGWHNFKSTAIKPGWQVKDGTLACVDPHNAGDLCTDEKFDWFELELEFKMAPAANSGIMYHVTDEGGAAWATGPEIQLEDNKAAKTRSVAVGSTRSINRRPTRKPASPSTPPNPPANGTGCALSSARKSASTSSTA